MPADDRLLDLNTRRRLYRYIQDNPGMHLRGIQRAVDMPLGTVEYHLHQMEKNEMLTSRDDGRFKAFFAKEGIDRRDKDILYYVRQDNPRRIMIHLLEHPDSSHAEAVRALPVGPSTVSFHMSKLQKAGLIEQRRHGRSKLYSVVEPDRVANVLVKYRKSFLDDLVDRFASSWIGMPPAEEPDEDEGPDEETQPLKAEESAPLPDPTAEPTDEEPPMEPTKDADRDERRDTPGDVPGIGSRMRTFAAWLYRTVKQSVQTSLV